MSPYSVGPCAKASQEFEYMPEEYKDLLSCAFVHKFYSSGN